MDPLEMDDEMLQEGITLLAEARLTVTTMFIALTAEQSRRSEIKLCRVVDGMITPAELAEKHDASWYASRQTEEQFLAEMGVGA